MEKNSDLRLISFIAFLFVLSYIGIIHHIKENQLEFRERMNEFHLKIFNLEDKIDKVGAKVDDFERNVRFRL